MDLGYEFLGLLFGVGIVAGCVDAIAGGGGLLAIPVLFTTGLPAPMVFGTAKLQAAAGSLSASFHFLRRGEVTMREMAPVILFTAVGAILGAWTLGRLDPSLLRDLIPVLLILIAAYTILAPRFGDGDARERMGAGGFAPAAGLSLGFYDGFFGPGAGSFWAMAYVLLRGRDLKAATARAKIGNCASNLASFAWFAAAGQVAWTAGLAMAAGQLIGARIGAGLVIRGGTRLIRPVMAIMCIAITARMVQSDPTNILRVAALSLADMIH